MELNKGSLNQNPDWSQGVAVGDEKFIIEIQNKLGIKTVKRQIEGKEDHWMLHEPGMSYN